MTAMPKVLVVTHKQIYYSPSKRAFTCKLFEMVLTFITIIASNLSKEVCPINQDIKRILMRLGVSKRKVHVLIPESTLDDSFFKVPSLERNDERIILFIGRLSPEKGLDTLIHAFAILRKSHKIDAKLWIIGEGPLKDNIEKAAKIANVNSFVKLIGIIPHSKIIKYLEKA